MSLTAALGSGDGDCYSTWVKQRIGKHFPLLGDVSNISTPPSEERTGFGCFRLRQAASTGYKSKKIYSNSCRNRLL